MEFISSEKTRDRYDIANIIEDFNQGILKDGDEVDIKGAIHNIRDMSDFAFIILRGGRLELQCVYAPEDNPSFTLADIEEEDCVIAHGRIVKEERSRRGFDVRLLGMTVLSRPAEKLPFAINKKKLDANIDVLLDNRVITMRHPKEKAIFRIADGVLAAFRGFMREEGFTEFVTGVKAKRPSGVAPV